MSVSNKFTGTIDLMTPPIRTIYLYPNKDSIIYDVQYEYNYGSSQLMTMSKTELRGNSAVVMNFAGITKVPAVAFANLLDIKLQTSYNKVSTVNKANIYEYDKGDEWAEDTITWENAPEKGALIDTLTIDSYTNRFDIENRFLAKRNSGIDEIGFYIACEGQDKDQFQMYSRESGSSGYRPRIVIRYYDISVTPFSLTGITCSKTDMTGITDIKKANAYVIAKAKDNDIDGVFTVNFMGPINTDITCEDGLYIPKYTPFETEIKYADGTSKTINIGTEYQDFKDIIPAAYEIKGTKSSEKTENEITCEFTVAAIAPGSTIYCVKSESEVNANFRVAKLFAMDTTFYNKSKVEIGKEETGKDYILAAVDDSIKNAAITSENANDIVCDISKLVDKHSKLSFAVSNEVTYAEISCEKSDKDKNLYIVYEVEDDDNLSIYCTTKSNKFQVAKLIDNAAEISCEADGSFVIDPLRYSDINCSVVSPENAATSGFRVSKMFAFTTNFYKLKASSDDAATVNDFNEDVNSIDADDDDTNTTETLLGSEKSGDDYIVGKFADKDTAEKSTNDIDIICAKNDYLTFEDVRDGIAEGFYIEGYVPTADDELSNMTIINGRFAVSNQIKDVDINCEKTPEDDIVNEFVKLSEVNLIVEKEVEFADDVEVSAIEGSQFVKASDVICDVVDESLSENLFQDVLDGAYETTYIEGNAITGDNIENSTIYARKAAQGIMIKYMDFAVSTEAKDTDIYCELIPEDKITKISKVNLIIERAINEDISCDVISTASLKSVLAGTDATLYIEGKTPYDNNTEETMTIYANKMSNGQTLSTVDFLVKQPVTDIDIDCPYVSDDEMTVEGIRILDNANLLVIQNALPVIENSDETISSQTADITCAVIDNLEFKDALTRNDVFFVEGYVPNTNLQKQKQSITAVKANLDVVKISKAAFVIKKDAIEVTTIEEPEGTEAYCDIIIPNDSKHLVIGRSVFTPDDPDATDLEKGDLITCPLVENLTTNIAYKGLLVAAKAPNTEITCTFNVLGKAPNADIDCENNEVDFVVQELKIVSINCANFNKNGDKTIHDFLLAGSPGMWLANPVDQDITCENNEVDFVVEAPAGSYAFIL